MTLNPFVMGSAKRPGCFDEKSPCTLEQTSMCVISVATKADPSAQFPGQEKYVPWLSCMDSKRDAISECNKEAGVDSDAVSQCMKTDAPELLKQYIPIDKPIRATPTVHINGKQAKTSYRAIHTTICKAEPSLKGCSAEMPDWADWEPESTHVPPSDVVV